MKRASLLKREKRKFVLTIGDEGAILVCVDGKKMVSRVFVASPNSPELASALSSFPEAPIYVLVDVVDQAYIQSTLPPVSSLNVSKLVKRKLSKDFDKTDLKAAISMGREKEGRKDWNYLFVSIKNISPFSDWIDAVSEMPNKFAGIFLLPLEGVNYLEDLKKVVFQEKGNKQSGWQIIVSHHRVGGFRQMVFRNDTIIFTRIAQPIGGQTPDVVAGNIEQETLNTIEYIRRLGFEDSDGLDLYIIASFEVISVLDLTSFPSDDPHALTPYDIAEKLGFENSAEPKDRFGDVVSAIQFITRKKHILKLHTKYTGKMELISKFRVISKVCASACIIATLVISAKKFNDSIDLNNKVNVAKYDRRNAEEKLKEMDKFRLHFDEEPKKIKEIARLDKILSKDTWLPFEIISNYANIHGFDTHVSVMTMDITENTSLNDTMKTFMDIEFISKDEDTLDVLFDNVELFASDVRRQFDDYKVTFSGLPGQDTIDPVALAENITIKLGITSPEDEKTKNKKR